MGCEVREINLTNMMAADQVAKTYISHKVSRVDSLVSLALKYSVNVQDLKRENKLWNNDHLFLRESLLIPLTAENENSLDETDTIVIFDGKTSNNASPSSSQSHLPNGDAGTSYHEESETRSKSSSLTSSSPPQSKKSSQSSKANGSSSPPSSSNNGSATADGATTSSTSSASSKSRSMSTPSDFFSKYDTNIARLKGDVAKMEKNAASSNTSK